MATPGSTTATPEPRDDAEAERDDADAAVEAFDSPELRALKALKWESGRALTAHVQDLALRDGKRAMVATSGGSFKKFVCSSETPCMWLVNAVRTRPRARKKMRLDGGDQDRDDSEPGVESEAETARRKYWYISSAYLLHTNCTGMAKPTARQLKDVLVLKQAVQHDTKISSASLVEQLKSQARLLCSKSMVYKAKIDLLDELESEPAGGDSPGAAQMPASIITGMSSAATTSEVQQSTQRLPSYLARLSSLNPDILHAVERDPSSNASYYRAVVALAPLRLYSTATPLVFGLDSTSNLSVGSTPFKPGGNAQLLLLIGCDANLDTVTLAVAHVPEPSEEHITWFLTKLIECGYPLQRANAMYCDGRWAASSACVRVGIHCMVQDMRYLIDDLSRAIKQQLISYDTQHPSPVHDGSPLGPDHVTSIWAAQRAESEGEFYAALHKLEVHSSSSSVINQQLMPDAGVLAAQQLRGLDPRRWALFPRFSSTRLFGWQTTRFSPSNEQHRILLDTCRNAMHLPCEMFKAISLALMNETYQRHERAVQWEREQRVVTPEAERLMQEEMKFVPLYDVAMSAPHVAFVWNPQEAPQLRQRRVDLQARSCTCAVRLQFGVPCRHILSVLRKINALGQSFDFFDDCLRVRGYVDAHKGHHIDLPLDETLELDSSWMASNLLPLVTGGDGQVPQQFSGQPSMISAAALPRKRRIRNKPAEQRKRPLYKCRKCSIADGHNSMTCPNRRVKKTA